MLKIRTEQFEAFASPDMPHFESTSITHIRNAFPKHFSFLGEAGAQEVVNYGRMRAKRYGLTDSSSALLYIDLTLLLGRGFDEDIQLRWAAGILNDQSLVQPLVKAERLHEYAMAYLDKVSGVNNEYIDQAQRTLLNQPPVVVSEHTSKEFEQEALDRLLIIWPQKYNYLGQATVLELIRYGVKTMCRYEISTPVGALIGIVAMYMLGSGFDRDPLFSWAARILNDKGLSQSDRTERLYQEGINYLKCWCAFS